MSTYEQLQSVATRLEAEEAVKAQEIRASKAEQNPDAVVIAAARTVRNPFLKLCLEAYEALRLAVGDEHVLLAEFRSAVDRFMKQAETQAEVPSAVLRRALASMRPDEAPTPREPLISSSRVEEINGISNPSQEQQALGAWLGELNTVWLAGGSYSVLLLLREILQALAQALGYQSLSELSERHPGGATFRGAVARLQTVLAIEAGSMNPRELRLALAVANDLDLLLEEWHRMTT